MSGGMLISRVRMLGRVCEVSATPSCQRARETCSRPAIVPPTPLETIRIGPVTVAPMFARSITWAFCIARRMSICGPRSAEMPARSTKPLPLTRPPLGEVPAKLASCSREPEKRPRARTLRMSVPVSALCTRSASPASEPRTCGLPSEPVTSAATCSVPVTSISSTVDRRHSASAGPSKRSWANRSPA